MATVIGCEYHLVAPVVAGDIVSVSGPYLDKFCENNCTSATGDLQIVYKTKSASGSTTAIPTDPDWPCYDWINSAAADQLDPTAEPKQVFYGTLAEFWGNAGIWNPLICPVVYNSGGEQYTICCNTKMGANSNMFKQQVYDRLWYNGTVSRFDWNKRAVAIDQTYEMGEM